MNQFEMMGLSPKLVARLEELGMTEPTPIQGRAIPLALEGEDVMGLAQTGTGKTAAFGLPLVEMLTGKPKPAPQSVRGLVLAPTRELAKQISDHLRDYVHGSAMKITLVVGGASINPQIKRLERGTDILVATPGRLMDLMDRRALSLAETKFLVLDEADQMLDLGFIHALRKIAAMLPSERQTMLFSATMPKQMSEIAEAYLTNPKRVQVNPPGKAADKIDQSIHFIAKAEKNKLLAELLGAHRDERAVVFGRTKHGMERLAKMLDRDGFSVVAVHGNKSQGQRERAISAFRSGQAMILVATDVAARGLDIPDVKHVYNYELPNVAENYVHRIGRTARAGKDGKAIALCAPDEMGLLKDIQKVMKATIPVASGRAWDPVEPEKKGGGNRRRGGGGGGGGGGRPGAKFGGKPGGGKPGGPNGGGNRRRGPSQNRSARKAA